MFADQPEHSTHVAGLPLVGYIHADGRVELTNVGRVLLLSNRKRKPAAKPEATNDGKEVA